MTDIFRFVSTAYPEDTFSVVKFTGREAISELYKYNILLVSEDPEINLKEVLKNPATFTIITPEEEYTAYGIIASFEQLQETRQRVFYRATLVPRLWQSDLYRDNQLFLEKTVPVVIEEILAQAGLTTDDYELRLTATYPEWEYVCQFRESDFDFMSRWMEREGIYYYFEQTDEGDKLIITDSSTSHTNISGESEIPYSPPTGIGQEQDGAISSFICKQHMLPKKVQLRDYNYRRPTLDLKGEADVDAQDGRGTVYLYGEHFKTPEEGNALARIRAEELLCREKVFYGESTAVNLCPGFFFDLSRHYRNGENGYNQTYLITEVTHSGKQGGLLMGDAQSENTRGEPEQTGYQNSFTAIPSDVQFRPERKTPKSRFYGTMNARVDAAGDGEFAEIDDEGRYKVSLPFDQSGIGDGKASRYMRMAQPYAGAGYGMHFPLHKGTEVMLAFVDGDPDRPIIAGSVPNPDTMSPITGGNQDCSMIRTAGGSMMTINDRSGQVALECPTEDTKISIGSPNEGNIFFRTSGTKVERIKGTEHRAVDGDVTIEYGQSKKVKVAGGVEIEYKNNVFTKTHGSTIEEFVGTKTSTVQADTTETFGGTKTSFNKAATIEFFGGAKSTKCAAGTEETFVGAKVSTSLAATYENFVGIKLSIGKSWTYDKSSVKCLSEAPINEIKGKNEIKLVCGGSKISITNDQVKINASKIILAGGGGEIRIVSSGIALDGKTSITEETTIADVLNVSKEVHAKNIDG